MTTYWLLLVLRLRLTLDPRKLVASMAKHLKIVVDGNGGMIKR